MSGPGPKEPPFVTSALHAVAEAIGIEAAPLAAPTPVAAAPVVAPSTLASTITAALDKAHAAERAAIDKVHAGEMAAADALDHIWQHVDNLVQRFPNAGAAKDQLEAAFRSFASAIGA